MENNPIRNIDPDGDTTVVGNGRGANPAFAKCKCDGNPNWDNVQKNMDKVSDASGDGELTGIAVSAGGAPEVGVPIMVGSAAIGTTASAVSAVIDVAHGEIGKALTKGSAVLMSQVAGGAIKSSTVKEGVKLALNAVKVIIGKAVDKAISTAPSNAHEKMSMTMQRSSIPKPAVPHKSLLKKDDEKPKN